MRRGDETNTALVSVVIPTYNRASKLENSIRSVLRQTYWNIEVLVVDDGSTDNSVDIINALGDERIKCFRRPHLGACEARNYGMKQAVGDYIAFHDSDDVWFPVKLERQLARLQESAADVCFCRMHSQVDKKERQWYVPAKSFSDKDISIETMLAQNYISTQTLIGRTPAMLSEQFDPEFPRLQDIHIQSFVLRTRRKRSGIASDSEYRDVIIHGSCFIVSPLFIRQREQALNPNTHMFYEMEILNHECRFERLPVLYSPEIHVTHHHSISVYTAFPDAI